MGKIYWNRQYELTPRSVLKFYRNRILRIAPLLYLNILVLLCLKPGIHTLVGHPWTILGDLLFLNNLTGRDLNAATWSLSFEMQDYLICPLFFLWFSRKSKAGLVGVFTAMTVLTGYFYYSQMHPEYTLFALGRFSWHFFGGYSVNLLVRYVYEDLGIRGGRWSRVTGFLLFLSSTGCFWWLYNDGWDFLAQVQLLLSTMASLLLFELPEHVDTATTSPLSIGTFLLRGLTWLGYISYGVYLWGTVILDAQIWEPVSFVADIVALRAYLFGTWPIPLFAFATTLVLTLGVVKTLVLSWITFILVEVRFRPNLYNYRESRILSRYPALFRFLFPAASLPSDAVVHRSPGEGARVPFDGGDGGGK